MEGAGAQGPLPEPCLACAFCRGRAGNPVEFATDAGLQNHYLRQSGARRNWHHASQAAYDQRAQQARASATGTGTAGAPNPKDESGTQAPPPTETIVPYERAKAPEPEPSRQRTIAELRSFVGDSPYTGKVVNSEKGRLTIATTTKTRNQAGQVLREEETGPAQSHPVGGRPPRFPSACHIRLSFCKREVSEANFKLFALAFQTIYDAAAKRAHNSTRCVMHYATGNSEEEGATLKLTHGETAFQKVPRGHRPGTKSSSRSSRTKDLLTVATHARTSERRRTTTAGIGMKIGELLPNGLGNRGSPIAGTNDAFSPGADTVLAQ